ncbi:hypothetical protein A20C1_11894 [marine actinobacterium PHSC20C1]|nr:hypothetical protein A20C1_11894 [marine actinobacterium PHSC20C1]
MIGVWRSLVARFVRDEEVVGSNPATPTTVMFRDMIHISPSFGRAFCGFWGQGSRQQVVIPTLIAL